MVLYTVCDNNGALLRCSAPQINPNRVDSDTFDEGQFGYTIYVTINSGCSLLPQCDSTCKHYRCERTSTIWSHQTVERLLPAEIGLVQLHLCTQPQHQLRSSPTGVTSVTLTITQPLGRERWSWTPHLALQWAPPETARFSLRVLNCSSSNGL